MHYVASLEAAVSVCMPSCHHSHVSASYSSPMTLSSSPDTFSTLLQCNEVIDIDLLGSCADSGEYAKEIFTFLREAEVSHMLL